MVAEGSIAGGEGINLLERTRGGWDDLAGNTAFQNALGWACKQLADADVPAPRVGALKPWVLKSASLINRSNYLLTRGLILFTELRTAAVQWLSAPTSETLTPHHPSPCPG